MNHTPKEKKYLRRLYDAQDDLGRIERTLQEFHRRHDAAKEELASAWADVIKIGLATI